jgi:adhesin transport system membrane fusion protein
MNVLKTLSQWTAKSREAPSTKALLLPLPLESGRMPGFALSLLTIGSLFVVATVAWGSVTEVNELTIAPGQLRPAGSVHSVQHLEGGQVEEILVSEGQIVEKGTPIVRLQPVQATADLGQLDARRANLQARIERLTALIEHRPLQFGPEEKRYPEVISDEEAAFATAQAQYAGERKTLHSQVEQRQAESEGLKSQVDSLKRQLSLQQEQLSIRKDLVAEGYVSKSQFIELQRETEKINEQLQLSRGQLSSAVEALNESQIKLAEYDSKFASQLSEERTKSTAELAEVAAVLPKQADRVERLTVRAPVKGIVQELVPKSVGQVMRPGEMIASIVPIDEDIVAEVQIAPQEIAHVRTGQRAELQVSTFDSVRYGKVPGTVRQISATTFQTQEGVPYYKAILSLDRDFVTFLGQRQKLVPGMVVQAEIATGSKSLMAYMLKPIYNNYAGAFSER